MYLSHYIQEHPFFVVTRMLIQLLPKAVRYFVCLCPKHKLTPVLQFSFLKVQREELNLEGNLNATNILLRLQMPPLSHTELTLS